MLAAPSSDPAVALDAGLQTCLQHSHLEHHLNMPGMGGREAMYLIRNEERDRLSLERMAMVAYTSEADVDEAGLRAGGFDALLKKPCSGPALEDCLLHWCPSLFAPQPG